MDKILIFVSKKEQFMFFRHLVNSQAYSSKNIIAISDTPIQKLRAPEKENIIYKTLSDYELDKHNVKICAEEAQGLIQSWPNLAVTPELMFKDLISYKGTSLWHVFDNAILMYYFIDLAYYIKIISWIIESEKPQEIIVLGSKFDLSAWLFLKIAQQKRIPVILRSSYVQILLGSPLISAFEKHIFLKKIELIVNIPFAVFNFGLFLRNTFNLIWAKFYNFTVSSQKVENKKIVFFVPLKKQLDSIIPVVEEFRNRHKISSLLITWHRRRGGILQVLRQTKLSHRVFEGYSTYKINKMTWRINKEFFKKWKLIEQSHEFKAALIYNNVSLWEIVQPYLKKLFLRHFCDMARMFEIAGCLYNIEKPKIALLTNDREFNARIAIIAAQSKNILAVDIVRELFADTADRDAPIYTDKEIVDGKYSYDILIKGGAPAEKLIISANPRWDAALMKRRYTQKDRIFDKLNIDKQKKLVVWATTFINPFKKQDEYEKTVYNLCKTLKDLPECHLVIKLHPGDTNEKVVSEICREIGIKNVTVIRDINLFDLFSVSELVIISYSTTGLEAVVMDKPVVVVNLSKACPEIIPFISRGVALGIFKEEDFQPVIKEVLENRETRERLKVNREKFISEHIQNLDGQAAQRVVKVIIDMIN